MASRFLHDPKYALMYGLLALLLLLSGALLCREAGQLRERAEGMAAENQLLLSYRHAEPGCGASGSPFVALSKGTGFGLWEAARGGRRLRGRDLRGKGWKF